MSSQTPTRKYPSGNGPYASAFSLVYTNIDERAKRLDTDHSVNALTLSNAWPSVADPPEDNRTSFAEFVINKLCEDDGGRPRPPRPDWLDRRPNETDEGWEIRTTSTGAFMGYFVSSYPVLTANDQIAFVENTDLYRPVDDHPSLSGYQAQHAPECITRAPTLSGQAWYNKARQDTLATIADRNNYTWHARLMKESARRKEAASTASASASSNTATITGTSDAGGELA